MLKKLLFIGAIIAFMPLDREKQAELFMAAKSTVADISGFCDHNPQVCQKGHAAMDKLATKAEFSAKMVLDIARNQSKGKVDEVSRLLKSTPVRPMGRSAYNKRSDNPLPVASNERFPSYRNNQYNEMYGANSDRVLPANTLSAADLKPRWQGERP